MTSDRAGAVAERLERAARSSGIPDADTRRLIDALTTSLDRRRDRLRDPYHSDFLHPARTALILLHDTPLTDADALTAAVLFDTEAPSLTFGREEAEAIAGSGAAAILAELPVPSSAGQELLELLVTADERVRLVALAERLDHARHLHLRPTDQRYAMHGEIVTVYLPVAERTDATLARRLHWWAEMFAERYL